MVTRKIACAAGVLLTGIAGALAADAPQFKLRGDRFKPLAWEEMSPEQKSMLEHLLSGPRGSLDGPLLYQTVAMLVDVDRYPLPEGVTLPLRPLKR